jgi:hypothetical protein
MALKFSLGQWVLEVFGPEAMESVTGAPIAITGWRITNPDPVTGKRRFYEAAPGQYGQPLLKEEPDGGIAIPGGLSYVDPWGNPSDLTKVPDARIVGAIFQEEDGRVAKGADGKPLRFSFSNPDAPELAELSSDGSVTVGGDKWYLVRLHQANQARLSGLVAFFRKTRPDSIIVSELAHVGV